jgi:hypothetical protein
MGLFSGDKSKGSSDSGETRKKLKQQKKKLALDQQINDLRMQQAELQGKGDSWFGGGGDSGGEGSFWTDWYGKDWDI